MSLCFLDDLLKSTELAPNVRSDSDSDLREVGLILSSLEVLSELGKDLIDTECRDF